MIRVSYLGSIVVSVFLRPLQNLMFIIDEDEVASNNKQLELFTRVFSISTSNLCDQAMGHLRVGTTRCDDGSLAIEDLCAISDLVAGAISDFFSTDCSEGRWMSSELVRRIRPDIDFRTAGIIHWLSTDEGALRKIVLFLDGDSSGRGVNVRSIKFHRVED